MRRRQIRRQVTERRRERNVDSCIFFFLTFGFREHKHILSLHTGPKLHQIWTIVAMVLDKSGLVGSRITSLDCKVVLSSLCFALVCSPTLFTSIYFNIFNIFIYVCRIFISLDCRMMLGQARLSLCFALVCSPTMTTMTTMTSKSKMNIETAIQIQIQIESDLVNQ